MSILQQVGEDSDAPVGADGKYKSVKRDLDDYIAQLSTLMDGKIRRLNVPTGDIFEPEFNDAGKVTNKNKIGRGAIEYEAQMSFEAAASLDEQGRSLRVTPQRLGVVDESGVDYTRFLLQWMPKRPMSPHARAGLNARILRQQVASAEKWAKAAAAAPEDEDTALMFEDAKSKVKATQERIAAETASGQAAGPKPVKKQAAPAAPAPAKKQAAATR